MVGSPGGNSPAGPAATTQPGPDSQSPKSPAASPRSRKSSQSPPKASGAGQTGSAPQSPGEQAQAETADGPILADEEADEAYDLDDNASSSASITSSIMRYRYENGRRYHAYKDGAYIAPNDDIENERLDLQHYMYRHMTFDGQHFLCPADTEKMRRVLDVGTGTGLWAIEFADDHPHIEVVGIDLSPTQEDFVPPNVRFYVDDIQDPWNFSHPFDFIYSRNMTGSIADFPAFFTQCYDNLTPGGWVEMADMVLPFECEDDTMTANSAAFRWSELFLEGMTLLGKPVNTGTKYAEWMADAGFTNIVRRKFRWPINHWPKDPKYKELGIWTYENIGKGLSGISLAVFTRVLGWSQVELEVFLAHARREFKDPSIHAYAPIWVTYGQKPGDV